VPSVSTILDALKKAGKLIQDITPDDLPIPKDAPYLPPLPPLPGVSKKLERLPAQGVIVFAEAVKAVDDVLKRGLFDWEGETASEMAGEVVDKLLNLAFGADPDYQADVIYERMRKKILPQTNPKQRFQVKSVRKRVP